MEAALRIPACDGLELDVRASSDGVPILLHDASLLRAQGVDTVPSVLTAAECAASLTAATLDRYRPIRLADHVSMRDQERRACARAQHLGEPRRPDGICMRGLSVSDPSARIEEDRAW
jgi:glycerophosphoryl diester phosphodiesterase